MNITFEFLILFVIVATTASSIVARFLSMELGALIMGATTIFVFFMLGKHFVEEKKEARLKEKAYQEARKKGSFWYNLWTTEKLLKETGHISMARSLRRIQEKALDIEPLFESKSQYELFLQTRVEQYIDLYLNYIADHKGSLNEEDGARITGVFANLDTILSNKRTALLEQRDSFKKIEMTVVEGEIRNALKE